MCSQEETHTIPYRLFYPENYSETSLVITSWTVLGDTACRRPKYIRRSRYRPELRLRTLNSQELRERQGRKARQRCLAAPCSPVRQPPVAPERHQPLVTH